MAIINRCKIGKTLWKVNNMKGLMSPDLGSCDHKRKTITVPVNGDTKDELDTIIHEVLHAEFPFLVEEYVNRCAKDLSRILWKFKWRKDDP